jgi:protein CpxP
MDDSRTTPAKRGGVVRGLLLAGALCASFGAGAVVMSGRPAAAFAEAVQIHMGGGEHGDMQAMMAAHLDGMLTQVDASQEQKDAIKQDLGRAFASLAPLHSRMHDTHAQLHQILTAPRVDRAALERLRAARVADLDKASRVFVSALADSAEVLTPEQREKLGAASAAHHQDH